MNLSAVLVAFFFLANIASAQNGWRMGGHDGSRTNLSPAHGPSTLPTFQPLITNAPGTFSRIGPDGSLVFRDQFGSTLSSYTSLGAFKWTVSATSSDVAIGPDGTVITSTPSSVTALNKDTGQPVWPSPFTSGLGGNETGSLAIDSAGVIYVYTGVPRLTAIKPDGTLKWQTDLGSPNPVLTADESTVYVQTNSGLAALSTTNGVPVGGAVYGAYAAAPWGPLYSAPGGSFQTFGLWECTLTSCNQIAGGSIRAVATFIRPSTIIVYTNSQILQAIDRGTGNILWAATEDFSGPISDANGTIYAIAMQTNDLVALNGLTGVQLWRQHFAGGISSNVLLGDDGSLYVSSGMTLYKSNPGVLKPKVIIVPGIPGTKLTATDHTDCPSSNGPCIVWLSNDAIGHAFLSRDSGEIFAPLQYGPDGNPKHTLILSGIFNMITNPGNGGALDCNLAVPNVPLSRTLASFYNSLSECQRSVNTYNALSDRLQQAGYSVGTFPYDWRGDIGELSEQMYAAVQASATPSQQVALVAHSMGGLLVGEMLRRHPEVQSLITNVVTLGTPFDGSVEPYLELQGWRSLNEQFLSKRGTRETGQYWTSPYLLLPRSNFVTDATNHSISYQSIYQGSQDLFPALARQSALPVAYSLWNASKNISPPTTTAVAAIIGKEIPTTTAIQILSRDPYVSLLTPCLLFPTGNGDGTVTVDSAKSASWILPQNRRFINDSHPLLPSNPTVLDAIIAFLNTGVMPIVPNILTMEEGAAPPRTEAHACSPADLGAHTGGQVIADGLVQVKGSHYVSSQHGTQVTLPAGRQYSLMVQGTGTGDFTLILDNVDLGTTILSKTTFQRVPVRSTSSGTIQITDNGVGVLSYDYSGKGEIIDTIPANTTPPTILCTGCYFTVQNLRATLGFNVGYQGGVSTFSYNYRSATQTVQFASMNTSQISASGTTSTFSGQGTLNGQPGYSFTVTARDLGPSGSNLDTVSIAITGPNNYSYAVTGTVVGGDIVVHP